MQKIVIPDGAVAVLPRFTLAGRRYLAEEWLRDVRKRARAVIYEADDDLWTEGFTEHIVSSRFQQGLTVNQLEEQRKANQWFVSKVDGVTVSSEPLAEVVRQYTDAPVVVVPNALDVRWFRAQLAPKSRWADTLTIGWAGGRRPDRDIAEMAIAWGRIAKRYPEIQFVVCGPSRPTPIFEAVGDDARIIMIPWLDWDSYPQAYQVDIGCCSVADTPFSRAKTPIKAWEYAAAGAAVVATPTLYGDCAEGRTFVAESEDAWERALSEMIEDERWRIDSSARLMQHVTASHALDTQAARWPEAYAAILNRQPSGVY